MSSKLCESSNLGSDTCCGGHQEGTCPLETPVSSLNIKWKFCHLSCGVVRMWTGRVVADMADFGL